LDTLVKIWVINLKSRPDRLERIAKQLDQMGINWSRFEAIDGKKCKKKHLDISVTYGKIGELSDGTRACSASHYKCWQEFISSNAEFGIFLEDDVRLSLDFKKLVEDLSWLPKKTNIIKLEKFSANRPSKLLLGPVISKTISDTRETRRMYSRHCGAGAYLMSKNGAIKAVNFKKPFLIPVDHLLFNETISKLTTSLKPLILNPPIAWQSEEIGQGSDITKFTVSHMNRLKKFFRSMKRGYYEIRLLPYQLFLLCIGRAKIISVTKK
jgi:glycosyl transferase, family 25